jgi:hypothetical protein
MENILCVASDVGSEQKQLSIKIRSENHVLHRADGCGIELSGSQGPTGDRANLHPQSLRNMIIGVYECREIALTLVNGDDKCKVMGWRFIFRTLLD